MVTGFEILGAFSGGMGTIGLLLNSIKNVNITYTDIAHSRRRLELRHSELRYLERRMYAWTEKWERPLQKFWSEEAISEVETLKDGMLKEARLVREYIGGSTMTEDHGSELLEWVQRLHIGQETPRPSISKRIRYGLWIGERLERCLGNLDRYMNMLEKRADYEYYIVCYGIKQFDTSPTMQEVVDAETFFHGVRIFDTIMDTTFAPFNAFRQPPSVCGLLTARLEDAHNRILISPGCGHFTLSFLAQDTTVHAFSKLDVRVSLSSVTAEEFLTSVNTAMGESMHRFELGQLLSSTIRDLSFLDGALRKECLKADQVARARAALDAAIWTCLMWESHWLKRICGCGIVAANVGEEESQHAFLTDLALSSSFPYDRNLCKCARLESRLWLQLGLLLSELAIGRIIDASLDQPNTLWMETGRAMEEIEQEWLLSEVQERTSPGYYKAVLECFSSNRQETSAISKQLHMRFITERIVEPIRRYFEKVQSRRRRPELRPAFLHMEEARLQHICRTTHDSK